eukprot:CAMPEP_0172933922 /NCGR_PEP_ID=MMETSP1075-20121228/220752_1 /TAXON_ID=2916 /ORGANISM="Ceratium fusus, Strain PA161109" /LENGTH=169 /DNA_ID=CAMNT_0013795269 /DNA_START=172 /DNA_END=681 /DNA_ORIENTATION=+
MSSFLGHRVKSRTSLHAESNDVIETTNGTLATNKKKKKFAEFNVGDEVEAVIKRKTKFGTFCDINAEKLVLISGPVPFKRLLKFQERVKAKIKTIDLEKRQVAIEIPDLEQLVQGRSSPTSATPAQTKPKADGVKVKGGSINMDISGLELANVDVNYEKGTVQISVKSK